MRTFHPLFLLAACGGPSPAKLEALGDAMPRLPAPEARVYATHQGTPSDPMVASVVGDLPWEEALSGAAGALGIETIGGRDLDAWWVRWAALRAGYPYPVDELSFEQVPEGEVGARVLEVLAQAVEPGDHVGLVRVRYGDGDLWLGLIGQPRLSLGPVPRELPLGGELALESTEGSFAPGLVFAWVSPSGRLERGELRHGRKLVLTEQGEHWFELRDAGAVLASFPVYVGEQAPPVPPLSDLHRAARDAGALEDAAWELLDELRALYDVGSLTPDPILGPVARAHLDDRVGAREKRSGAFAGEPGTCRASVSCGLAPGGGVEACFQQWLVEPAARAALLDARCSVAGLATTRAGDRLWLQLELGEE